MKFASEFRDPVAARALLSAIAAKVDAIGATRDKPLHLMEICGGHTHSIFRYGLDKLMQSLYDQKYSPWQAELPGLDINFTQMPSMDLAKQKDMLRQVLEYFMAAGKGEATIMLAPTDILPKLADADAPSGDVQLFTITLRPASKNIVVDVAAYRESEEAR